MSCLPSSPCYSNGTVVYPRGCGIDPCHAHKTGTDLVFYNGANLPCVGVDTCDSVTLALQKIDQKLCPEALALAILGAIANNVSINNMFCTLVNQCIPTTTTTTSTSTSTTTSTTSTSSTTTSTTTTIAPTTTTTTTTPTTTTTTTTLAPTTTTTTTITPTTTTTTTSTTSTTTTTTTTVAPTTTTTTTVVCNCVEYINNTAFALDNISYTDCITGNPVGPIAITPGQSFCTSTAPAGGDSGFLTVLSLDCCP